MDSFILQQDKMLPETKGNLEETIVLPSNRQERNGETAVFPHTFCILLNICRIGKPTKVRDEAGIVAYAYTHSTWESEAGEWTV